MVFECPKCGRTVPDDSIYCPYCAHGLEPYAKTANVSVAGILMIVAAVASLILAALSIQALLQIYDWYPRLVAQNWFFYDQLLTLFSCIELPVGLAAATLSLCRKSYRMTIIAALLCTLAGAATWATSMIIPDRRLLNSVLYYFLPTFLPPLVATLLIYPRKAEFAQKTLKAKK